MKKSILSKVLITYHMGKGREEAEACAVLLMKNEIAADLLKNGHDSKYLNPMLDGRVYNVLQALSDLRDCVFTEAVSFEKAV